MRKQLASLVALGVIGFAAPSLAADLPAKAPVYAKAPVMAAVYNWTGFYIGAHVGYGWSDKTWCRDGGFVNGCANRVPGENFAVVNPRGFLGGLQAGYNWQTGNFVLGAEGQLSFSNLTGSADFRTFNSTWVANTDVKMMGTVAGRVGFAFDRTLIYGKVGLAWVSEDHWITHPIAATTYAKTSVTRTGWMLGAGVEQAIAGNWSAKVEYNYMNFGNSTVSIDGAASGAPGPVTISQNIHLVKVGVNYRFGGPVVARY